MQPTYLLVVFAIVVQQTFAQNLPHILQKCKVSDPNFNDCVLYSANNFISTVLKRTGKDDKPYIAVSDTLSTVFADNFTLKFINLSSDFYGNFVIKHIHFNFDKKLLLIGMESDLSMYTGRYEADGLILGKRVHECGNVNMTFDNLVLNAVVALDFKMKDEQKYLEAVSSVLMFDFKNFRFKPYDLMITGEPMTAAQRKVFDSYIAKIPQLLQKEQEKGDKDIVQSLNKLFSVVPFDNLFLP